MAPLLRTRGDEDSRIRRDPDQLVHRLAAKNALSIAAASLSRKPP